LDRPVTTTAAPARDVPDPHAGHEERLRFLLRFTSATSERTRAKVTAAVAKQRLKAYFKTQLPRILVVAAAGFVAGWLVNVWLMRSKYDGYRVPTRGLASGRHNLIRGSLIAFVVSMVVSALVSYRLRAGKHAFGKAARAFPERLKDFVRQDRADATVHLLWGFAGALVVVVVLGPYLTGFVAVGFLVFVGTVFRGLVMALLRLAWAATVARVAPRYAKPPTPSVAAVTMMAGVAAMVVGRRVVKGSGAQLVLAVIAGGAAFAVGRQRSGGSGVAAAAALLPLAFFAVLTVAGIARADDGGGSECNGRFSNCPGTTDLFEYAAAGGAAAAAGAAAGDALGAAASEAGEDDDGGGGGGGGEEPPCGPDEAAAAVASWDAWSKAHPGGSWDDFMAARIAQNRAEAQAVGQQLDEMQAGAQAIDDKLAAMQQTIKIANTPWNQLTKQQQQDVTKRVVAAYHQTHPGATADEVNSMTGQFGKDPNLTGMDMLQYVAGESLLGLPGATIKAGGTTLGMIGKAPTFLKAVSGAYWDTLTSGAQQQALKEVFVDPVAMLASRVKELGPGAILADAQESGMMLTSAGAKQFDQAVRAFDKAVKTGDGKAIANAIDGVAGQMLSDYLLTAGAGKVVNLSRSGLEAAGLVKAKPVAQAAEWSEAANGIPLDTPEKRAAAGYSENATQAFQEAVDEHGATLQMQKRGADAVQHEGAAYMKPQDAKAMKSIGPLDAELGGPKSEGLLAFYEPKNPLAAAGSPIQKRYEMLQTLYESVPGKDLAAKQAYITKQRLEVWVNGKKTQLAVAFDKEGVLRGVQNGKPIVSDYDGWAVLDEAGQRRLGYNEAGERLLGAEKQADRSTKVPLIRKLVDDPRTQLQHAPASSEWGPIPALLAGAEPPPCFDCKTLAIAKNILNNVAKEGAVEFRPGAAHPYLTKPAGVPNAPQPTLKLPGGKPSAPTPKPKSPPLPVPRPTGGSNKK
jgi:hypothetical protein